MHVWVILYFVPFRFSLALGIEYSSLAIKLCISYAMKAFN